MSTTLLIITALLAQLGNVPVGKHPLDDRIIPSFEIAYEQTRARIVREEAKYVHAIKNGEKADLQRLLSWKSIYWNEPGLLALTQETPPGLVSALFASDGKRVRISTRNARIIKGQYNELDALWVCHISGLVEEKYGTAFSNIIMSGDDILSLAGPQAFRKPEFALPNETPVIPVKWHEDERAWEVIAGPMISQRVAFLKRQLAPPEAKPRLWVDNTGEFNVEATLVRLDDDVVTLKGKARIIKVTLDRLCEADRDYVNKWLGPPPEIR